MSLNDFVVIQKIGSGSFASVFKVRRLIDQKIYALKKIDMKSLAYKEKNNALNQVRLLACLNSHYIIGYCQSFFQQKLDMLCIAMQYADQGDLFKLISNHKKNRAFIPQIQIWKILIHLLYGLNELHTKNILHRDLKSQNIFICSGTYKIGDMNVSKIVKNGLAVTQTGTPYYASPQVWKDQPYNQKSDIWSLGCILFQVASLNPPFEATSMQKLFDDVTKSPTPKIPKNYSKQLQDVINSCLQKNPLNRPTTKELLQNFTIKLYQNLLIEYKPDIDEGKKACLLKTIYMPNSKKQLKSHLPQSNYKNNYQDMPLQMLKQASNSQRMPVSQPNIVSSLSISSSKDIKRQEMGEQKNQKRNSISKRSQNSKDNIDRSNNHRSLQKKSSQQKSNKKVSNSREKICSVEKIQTNINSHQNNKPLPDSLKKIDKSQSKKKMNSLYSNLLKQSNSISKQKKKQSSKQKLIAKAQAIIKSQIKQNYMSSKTYNNKNQSNEKLLSQIKNTTEKGNKLIGKQCVIKYLSDKKCQSSRQEKMSHQELNINQNQEVNTIKKNQQVKMIEDPLEVQELKPKKLQFQEKTQSNQQVTLSQKKTTQKKQELPNHIAQTQSKINTEFRQNNSIISSKNHSYYNFSIKKEHKIIQRLINQDKPIVSQKNDASQINLQNLPQKLVQNTGTNHDNTIKKVVQDRVVNILVDVNENHIPHVSKKYDQSRQTSLIKYIQGLQKINSFIKNKNLKAKILTWTQIKNINLKISLKIKEQQITLKLYKQSQKIIIDSLRSQKQQLVNEDVISNNNQISTELKRQRSKSMPKTEKLKSQLKTQSNKNSYVNIHSHCKKQEPSTNQKNYGQRKKIFQDKDEKIQQIHAKIKQMALYPISQQKKKVTDQNRVSTTNNKISKKLIFEQKPEQVLKQCNQNTDKKTQKLSKHPYCNKTNQKIDNSSSYKKVNVIGKNNIFGDKLNNFDLKKKKIFNNQNIQLQSHKLISNLRKQQKYYKNINNSNNAIFQMNKKLQKIDLQNKIRKYMMI